MMKSDKGLGLRIIIFILVCVVISVGTWFWWQDAITAVDRTDHQPIEFSIVSGEDVRSIVTRLAGERIIRSPLAFYVLVKVNRLERQIQAGDFRLSRSMDAPTISRELTHGLRDKWITTIEGWRNEEIAAKLSKELDIPETEFLNVAQIGYMFPDTYLIPRDSSAAAVVKLFTDTFDRKVTPSIRQDAQSLKIPFEDVITLASLVEREGINKQDRPIIAGILLNRLAVKQALQVDATLQYALGYQSDEKSWWKKSLTQQDKEIDSPYNTYKFEGLPPAPISNPGLESIEAVIHPLKTDYFYYLHDPQGGLHYAKTLEEHIENINLYLKN